MCAFALYALDGRGTLSVRSAAVTAVLSFGGGAIFGEIVWHAFRGWRE